MSKISIYRDGNPNDHVTLKSIFYRCKLTIGACDTFMERKFCELSEFVCFLKLRQLIKSIDMSKLEWDDFAHAHSDLNL